MRRNTVLCVLLLVICLGSAANGAEIWSISTLHPCTGLTAGFARPLAALSRLVGPRWQPAPGPVKGQGLVLLFVTVCPDSRYAGKPTGPFSGAFVLVPVEQKPTAGRETHAIAVLQVAGSAGKPVMKLFGSRDIPTMDARVSLVTSDDANGKHAQAIIHSAHGRLTLDAQFEPVTQSMKSTDTTAVRVSPPGAVFRGPESATRYAKGIAQAHATDKTWLQRYQLGTPLFVTLDTDFIWDFDFTKTPHR